MRPSHLPDRHRSDGDGWIDCACGQRHWGRFGAAGLLVVSPDRFVLLQHRAEWSHYGGTWGVPGGARGSAELPSEAALREAGEEAAVPADAVRPAHAWVEDHGTWSYTTVIAHGSREIEAYPADPESRELRWVPFDEVTDLPLHPGFAAAWPELRAHAQRRLVLVVDAANVVGSRPDGWWRDRAGANTRLRDSLALLAGTGVPAVPFGLPGHTWWPLVELVVEGAARWVEPVSDVAVHAASADGDPLITQTAAHAAAERPEDHVVVVTADRRLRESVRAAGAAVVGPRALLDALPGSG